MRTILLASAIFVIGPVISSPILAADSQKSADGAVHLGTWEPFWRYSAALGPFLEEGQALVEIPDFLSRGDFPYHRRPYPMEVPFADHLSIVRLLGGYHDTRDPEINRRDLAWRDQDGTIQYRMDLLEERLRPYLENGYTDLTLVMDNVPWCFPETPSRGHYGQRGVPRDPAEWRAFIVRLCEALVKIAGKDVAGGFRFRVGTENNGRERFDGSHEQFLDHYDHTAAAIRSVLPDAQVGPFNISGASMRGIEQLHNVNALALARHCAGEPNRSDGRTPTPLGWVAYSRYFRPEMDVKASATACGEIWDEFDRRVPEFRGFSREIHEFGIAPFGNESKGEFISAEPGALGAALTARMMIHLRAEGIDRLWHWGVLDRFRGGDNQLRYLPTSTAWLLSIFDHLLGMDAWIFSCETTEPSQADHLVLACFAPEKAVFLIASTHPDTTIDNEETVVFKVPQELMADEAGTTRFLAFDRTTALHDVLREQLVAADLLSPRFAERPDRVGNLRQMAQGREAEVLAGEHYEQLLARWEDTLTLKSPGNDIRMTEEDDHTIVTVRVRVPGVRVVVLEQQ